MTQGKYMKWEVEENNYIKPYHYRLENENNIYAAVYSKDNANLIVTAVNQCIELNPDNPQAVAEQIGEAFGLLNKILKQDGWLFDEDVKLLKELLTKAKATGNKDKEGE